MPLLQNRATCSDVSNEEEREVQTFPTLKAESLLRKEWAQGKTSPWKRGGCVREMLGAKGHYLANKPRAKKWNIKNRCKKCILVALVTAYRQKFHQESGGCCSSVLNVAGCFSDQYYSPWVGHAWTKACSPAQFAHLLPSGHHGSGSAPLSSQAWKHTRPAVSY